MSGAGLCQQLLVIDDRKRVLQDSQIFFQDHSNLFQKLAWLQE